MKLQTSIQPRRNGTVTVTGQDSQTYVFEADSDGELTCDVADEATVAALLTTDKFWPANPDDFETAEKLIAANEEEEADATDEEYGDDEEVADALPVEAETPPAPRRARKAK